MASLETDLRSCQDWFNGKQQKIEHKFLKAMKSNSQENEKYENSSGKTKHESSRPMGTKVSTIAHMFQNLSQQKSENSLVRSPVKKDAPLLERVQSPDGYKTERSSSLPAIPHSNCSLSRRGSHLTRFNNAKAMFEKLEKNKSDSKNPVESKPRANTIANLDCTKVQEENKKKSSEFSNGKCSDSVITEKSVSKKTVLSNDNFSKVTTEALKPIWANHLKKNDANHVSAENKSNNQKESKQYQKVILQNENNLSASSTSNDLPKEPYKSASHPDASIKAESVKSEATLLVKYDVANKFDVETKEDKKYNFQSENCENKTNLTRVSSKSDDKSLFNDTRQKEANHKDLSFELDNNFSNDKKDSQSSNVSHHQKVVPSLSTDSDLAYDNFQRALNNSNHYVKSSPFKIQTDCRNRTFDISPEKTSDPESSSDNADVNCHPVIKGILFK